MFHIIYTSEVFLLILTIERNALLLRIKKLV